MYTLRAALQKVGFDPASGIRQVAHKYSLSEPISVRCLIDALVPGQITESLFEGAPNPCRLLVIAPDEFTQSLAPLILHKNRTGMPAHLVILSRIVQCAPGPSEHPFAIKKLIAQAHERFGVWYVMLAGDARKIPVRHRFVRQMDGGAEQGMDGTYNPTDYYYANLYGAGGEASGISDWDGDHDGKYNAQTWGLSPASDNPDNVDAYPHVAIGRVPAHEVQDIANYAQKVIDYETGARAGSANAFTFLSDSNLPGSLGKCDSIIVDSKIQMLANAQVQRFDGNTPAYPPLPPNWEPFVSLDNQIAAFTAKWLIHIGHGDPTDWAIIIPSAAFPSTQRIDSDYIRNWNGGNWSSYPIVLSAGCSTGEFLNWAPNDGEYRGLDPDKNYSFEFDTTKKEVKDTLPNPAQILTWPLTVPVPHTYDYDYPGRTFAYAWLCGSATGGAIAYSGATLVHPGADYGSALFEHLLLQVGSMNILGDLWVQAQRDYLAEKLFNDEWLGSPRIYLSIQTLFGDPSLRLTPV